MPDQTPYGRSHIDALRADHGASLALLAELEKRTAGRIWDIVPLEKSDDSARTFGSEERYFAESRAAATLDAGGHGPPHVPQLPSPWLVRLIGHFLIPLLCLS